MGPGGVNGPGTDPREPYLRAPGTISIMAHPFRPLMSIPRVLALALPAVACLWGPLGASGSPAPDLSAPSSVGFAPGTRSDSPSPAASHPLPAFGRTSRILLAGGVAGFLSWQTEDADAAARFLEGSPLEGPVDIGDTYANGIVLGSTALGSLALGHLAHRPRLQAFGADLSKSLLVSSAVVWGLKLGINRTRPNGGDYSFPSGHAAVAFCAAPVFQKHFGSKVGVPAYALAVGAGLGRMEDRKHFLSDVVVGAAIGLAVGDAVIHPGFGQGLLDRIALGRDGVGFRVQF